MIDIHINCEGSLRKSLLHFAGKYIVDPISFHIESTRNRRHRDTNDYHDLWNIPYGISNIKYKDTEFKINYIKIGDPVGIECATAIYTELYLIIDETKYPIIRFNPAIKSMNYIGNMKAKKDAEFLGAYEPIFYNDDGLITECAIRNVFYIKDGVLLTPSLDLGVLPGVMRSAIINIAIGMGIKVDEAYIPFDSINDMDEAFISSTGIGLLPCYWDGWSSEFNLTQNIAKKLTQQINNLCE